MNDWFTAQWLDDATCAISEAEWWATTRCYLLLGSERALLIDSGMGVADLGEAVAELTALPVEVALTHGHWDHTGGMGCFEKAYINEYESEWVSGRPPFPGGLREFLECDPTALPAGFDAAAYKAYDGGASDSVTDGQVFELGGRTIRAIHTPGHTPGGMCYLDVERQWLYTGDTAYVGRMHVYDSAGAPADYMRSIKRLRRMEIKRILPGHGTLDVPDDLLARMDDAFSAIYREGKLKTGSGTHDFGVVKLML